MRGFVLLSAMLLAIGTLASAQTKATPTPPSAGGPKPFLSAASKIITPPVPSPTPIKFVSWDYHSSTPTPSPSPSASVVKPLVRFRPTKDGVEEPFYDVPWAVHIPIEVPFEGGGARITWQARVSWENPPQEWYEQNARLPLAGRGIYRLDGKQLTQLAVRRGGYALKWETDVPLPTYIWDATYSSAFAGEKEKHKPMVGIEDDAIIIDSVLPGWYAIWFVFDTASHWPQKEPKREFLQGVIHFDCIVSRGLEEPISAEKEYLFGRAKRPDKMQDDKFYKVSTVDVPFKLGRDSWEFDHAEVHLRDDEREKIEKKRVALGTDQYRKYEVQKKVSGKEVELTFNEKVQLDPRDKSNKAEIPDNDSAFDTVYLVDEKWKASFPPSLPDYSFGTLQLAGGQESRYQQKTQISSSASPTYNWEPGTSVSPGKVPENPGGSCIYQINITFHDVRSPTEKRFQSAEKEAREDFLHRYGNDAAEWFVPDYFEEYRTGPKKGEPPGQYVIETGQPYILEDATRLELGAYPLVAFSVGPWEICGFYKRLSEIENRVVASKAETGETTIVSDEDDFWKWFPELSEVIHKQKQIADRAVAEAALETLPLQKLLKSQKRLLFSMSQNGTGGLGEGFAGWLDNTFPKTGIGTLPGGSEPGSVNTPVTISDKERTLMQNKLGEITEDIRHARERISDRTEEARAAYKAICDKLEEGNEKFGGPGHAELYIWRQHYRKIYEQISFDIALASKDPEVLRRALADAEKESNSDLTRVLEAELHSVLGDSVGALTALRSAVEVNPQNTVAQMMLRDLECAFLKAAIDKSQGTIAEARRAFYGYMLERGFKEYHQLRTSGNWPFARAAAWTEYALDKYGEVPWAIFTTGLFGSMSALVDDQGGKPAAEADLLDTVEKRMVTAFIGLNTVLRLRGNGYKFDDIKKMTSTQIRDALPLRKINGDLYSDQDAALHRVAIRVAMEDLPDVKALVSNDKGALQLGLEKKYWNEKDVGDTWIEWIGDATSVYYLLQLLPSAKVGAGVRLGEVFWGEKEFEAIQAYEKSGEVISGTEFIANTIGLTDVLSQAGATDTGKAILKYLKALGRYQEDLGWLDTVIWTSGKLTALMGIDYVTVSAGEKLGGRKGGMLMQLLMMFGRDPETLVKLLDARNIPRQACAALIIDRYLPATKVHIKRLVQVEKSASELERLFERVKAGQRLMPQDEIFLDKYFEQDWRRLMPNGQASHDSSIALGAAAEGARNKVDNGAGKAVVEKMKAARQAEMDETTQAAEQAQQLANKLKGAQPAARGPPPPFEPPSVPRHIQRVLLASRRARSELGLPVPGLKNYPMPPVAQEMSESAVAEMLLMSGKYDEAEKKFEEIIQRVLKGEVQEADELPVEWLRLKSCLANELQGVDKSVLEKIIGPKKPSGLTVPLDKTEAARILSDPNSWEIPLDIEEGAFGSFYSVKGNDNLLIKVVPDKLPVIKNGKAVLDANGKPLIKEINVLSDVQNTMIHNELARRLGFEVPAMEVKLVYNAKGNVEKAVYLMRKIKGRPLKSLSTAEVFLYKQQMSRHRALAVLIGDYDRHIGNYFVTNEGHLVPLDAGLADVVGDLDFGKGPADPVLMEGVYGRDHYYSRYFKDEIAARDENGNRLAERAPEIDLFDPNESFNRKGLVAEESLTYKDSLQTVEKIKDIISDEQEFRKVVQDTYESAFKTDEVIKQRIEIVKDLKERINAERVKRQMEPFKIDSEQIRRDVITDIDGEIKQMVERTVETAKKREVRLKEVMKGLDQRHVVPRRTSQVSAPESEIFRRVVFLHVLKSTVLRRAA